LKKTKQKENFNLPKILESTQKIIKIAKKNHNSIKGTNHYAKKFLDASVIASEILQSIQSRTKGIVEESVLDELSKNVAIFFNPDETQKDRNSAQRKILAVFKLKIQQNLNRSKSLVVSDDLFPLELTKNTKPYLEKISTQACGSYDVGYYDASAVMTRRLLETLIIECFETKKISNKIKNGIGVFYFLEELISKFLKENGKSWNISRNTLKCLPKLKDMGDKSAHSRYFTARKPDIDKLKDDLRIVIEELVQISR